MEGAGNEADALASVLCHQHDINAKHNEYG